MTNTKEILNFINQFTNNGNREEVIECFTCGHCYWFAYILHQRFNFSAIVYDEIINHFGCQIGTQVYDITGDVTKDYKWELWDDVKKRDALLTSHIERDCIFKEN